MSRSDNWTGEDRSTRGEWIGASRQYDRYRKRIAYLAAAGLFIAAFFAALLSWDWMVTQLVWLASVFFVAGLLLSVWSAEWFGGDE